jgi:hypothetical protein
MGSRILPQTTPKGAMNERIVKELHLRPINTGPADDDKVTNLFPRNHEFDQGNYGAKPLWGAVESSTERIERITFTVRPGVFPNGC